MLVRRYNIISGCSRCDSTLIVTSRCRSACSSAASSNTGSPAASFRSGERLPSVRELADADRRRSDDGQPSLSRAEEGRADRDAGWLGHLRRRRLAPSRTSARRHGRSRSAHRHADRGAASRWASPPSDLLSLFNARIFYRAARASRSSRLAMVGDLSRRQRRAMRASSPPSRRRASTVDAVTLEALERDPALRKQTGSADLVVTFANRQPRGRGAVARYAGRATISFIPSEETRLALASLDPLVTHRHRLPLTGIPADHDCRRAALRAACGEDLRGRARWSAELGCGHRRGGRDRLCDRRRSHARPAEAGHPGHRIPPHPRSGGHRARHRSRSSAAAAQPADPGKEAS